MMVCDKAWMKMGQPLPEDAAERAKFLASIKVKEKAPEEPAGEVPATVQDS